jgi:uncharacterized protein YecE (DUF72 family)
MATFEADLSGLPGNLLVGTSSWSSSDWQGVFYGKGTRPGDYIAEYAKRFRTVEIDSSFYHAPGAKTVEGWAEKTPPEFIFSAKVPQVITHEKALVGCEEETRRFLEVMSLLGPRLGPLVFQFPYVAKGKDAGEYRTGADFRRRLAAYLELLPRGFRYAVEVRNGAWIDADFLGLLRERGVALVLSDYYTMPSLATLAERCDPLTGDFTLVRFLGNRKEMDDLIARKKLEEGKAREFDEIIVDRKAEMESWVPALKHLVPRTQITFAYFNNHYAGFGPGSAAIFAQMWREMKS